MGRTSPAKKSLLRRCKERGAAAVEFALVLPILLTFVLGPIEWGWFFFIHQRVVNAAREGARAGTLLYPPPKSTHLQGQTAAMTAAANYLTATGLQNQGITVDSNYAMADGSLGIQVSINYPYQPLTGFLGGLMPTHARTSAVMRW